MAYSVQITMSPTSAAPTYTGSPWVSGVLVGGENIDRNRLSSVGTLREEVDISRGGNLSQVSSTEIGFALEAGEWEAMVAANATAVGGRVVCYLDGYARWWGEVVDEEFAGGVLRLSCESPTMRLQNQQAPAIAYDIEGYPQMRQDDTGLAGPMVYGYCTESRVIGTVWDDVEGYDAIASTYYAPGVSLSNFASGGHTTSSTGDFFDASRLFAASPRMDLVRKNGDGTIDLRAFYIRRSIDLGILSPSFREEAWVPSYSGGNDSYGFPVLPTQLGETGVAVVLHGNRAGISTATNISQFLTPYTDEDGSVSALIRIPVSPSFYEAANVGDIIGFSSRTLRAKFSDRDATARPRVYQKSDPADIPLYGWSVSDAQHVERTFGYGENSWSYIGSVLYSWEHSRFTPDVTGVEYIGGGVDQDYIAFRFTMPPASPPAPRNLICGVGALIFLDKPLEVYPGYEYTALKAYADGGLSFAWFAMESGRIIQFVRYGASVAYELPVGDKIVGFRVAFGINVSFGTLSNNTEVRTFYVPRMYVGYRYIGATNPDAIGDTSGPVLVDLTGPVVVDAIPGDTVMPVGSVIRTAPDIVRDILRTRTDGSILPSDASIVSARQSLEDATGEGLEAIRCALSTTEQAPVSDWLVSLASDWGMVLSPSTIPGVMDIRTPWASWGDAVEHTIQRGDVVQDSTQGLGMTDLRDLINQPVFKFHFSEASKYRRSARIQRIDADPSEVTPETVAGYASGFPTPGIAQTAWGICHDSRAKYGLTRQDEIELRTVPEGTLWGAIGAASPALSRIEWLASRKRTIALEVHEGHSAAFAALGALVSVRHKRYLTSASRGIVVAREWDPEARTSRLSIMLAPSQLESPIGATTLVDTIDPDADTLVDTINATADTVVDTLES